MISESNPPTHAKTPPPHPHRPAQPRPRRLGQRPVRRPPRRAQAPGPGHQSGALPESLRPFPRDHHPGGGALPRRPPLPRAGVTGVRHLEGLHPQDLLRAGHRLRGGRRRKPDRLCAEPGAEVPRHYQPHPRGSAEGEATGRSV